MKAIDHSGQVLREKVIQTLRIRLIRLYGSSYGYDYVQAELHSGGLILRQKSTSYGRENKVDICREESVRLAKLILAEYC